MMGCTAWESMIALDVGGDLPSADAAKLTRHLSTCAACRRFAEDMRQSRRAVAMMADVSDDEVLATVRAGVLRELEDTGSTTSRFLLAPRVLAVAATIAVALGAMLLLRSGGPDRPLPQPRVAETPVAPQPPAPRRPIETETPTAEPPAEDEIVAVREPVEATAPQPRPPIAIATAPPAIQATAPRLGVSATRTATKTAEPPALNPSGVDASAVATPATEPMVIKLVSEDADVVIYWLVNTPDAIQRPSRETTKETSDEISAV